MPTPPTGHPRLPLPLPTKDRRSWSRAATVSASLLAAWALGGCATNPSNAQVGTGVGAVVGGAAGHVIFGGPVGTIGGAAAGALIGNELGKDRDRAPRRR